MPKNRFYLAFALAGSLCLASMPGFAAPAPAPAIAAPTTVAPVTIENRVAAQFQHEIAFVQPLLDRYGYGAVAVVVGALLRRTAPIERHRRRHPEDALVAIHPLQSAGRRPVGRPLGIRSGHISWTNTCRAS
ncbi:hypothetical protein [Candidatus Thiodictyon syntrophicum]|jgi:hypothetical protein|uniref:Uncharacterized protein n=1 Tax=Candidatus Thiodictyon syntrophicum TaxID=1166950 RepID=A0A2K8UEI6_9GAMM|nr:hypothetical protein [Candidatus Thiodictyon syntrophicum]AUB83984.1 hypothetical protein THSYN_25655 [Candidatus Thiodictyon syntrophicum]